jgi:hypothetical protein
MCLAIDALKSSILSARSLKIQVNELKRGEF